MPARLHVGRRQRERRLRLRRLAECHEPALRHLDLVDLTVLASTAQRPHQRARRCRQAGDRVPVLLELGVGVGRLDQRPVGLVRARERRRDHDPGHAARRLAGARRLQLGGRARAIEAPLRDPFGGRRERRAQRRDVVGALGRPSRGQVQEMVRERELRRHHGALRELTNPPRGQLRVAEHQLRAAGRRTRLHVVDPATADERLERRRGFVVAHQREQRQSRARRGGRFPATAPRARSGRSRCGRPRPRPPRRRRARPPGPGRRSPTSSPSPAPGRRRTSRAQRRHHRCSYERRRAPRAARRRARATAAFARSSSSSMSGARIGAWDMSFSTTPRDASGSMATDSIRRRRAPSQGGSGTGGSARRGPRRRRSPVRARSPARHAERRATGARRSRPSPARGTRAAVRPRGTPTSGPARGARSFSPSCHSSRAWTRACTSAYGHSARRAASRRESARYQRATALEGRRRLARSNASTASV